MTLDAFLRQFADQLGSGLFAPFAIALFAGVVASAVCPCTLPVGVGLATVSGATEGQSKRMGLAVAAAFFAGIVANLTVLGALAGRLGAIATEAFGRYWTLGMAVLSLVAAILAFWGPRLSTSRLEALRRPGIAGAFGYGFVFSLGTSAAPLLLLLTVAASVGDPLYGTVLAVVFGIGRGLPFLIIGVFASALMRFVRLERVRRPMQLVSGAALLLVSAYYARAFTFLL